MRNFFSIIIVCILLLCTDSLSHASDFRNATWGMSRDACYDSEEAKTYIIEDEFDRLSIKAIMFEGETQVTYRFSNDRLEEGSIDIRAKNEGHANMIFSAITENLSKKYPALNKLPDGIYEYKNDRTTVSTAILKYDFGIIVAVKYEANSIKASNEQEMTERYKKEAEKF